jgi:hypothetical protein
MKRLRPEQHHQEQCFKCGKMTAWHRPKIGSAPQKADPSTWVYVCFDDLPNYREDSRVDYGSGRKAQAIA